jgi:hypothetical protein
LMELNTFMSLDEIRLKIRNVKKPLY